MKRKKITALFLSLLLGLSATACAAPAEPTPDSGSGYTDVTPGDWFYGAVTYCQAQGLMTGTSPTRFDPQGSMTRAMLSTALYRQAGSPAVSGGTGFTDTDGESWYASAVLWAYQQGLITGYSPTRFGPGDPVTREQLVTILYRQAGRPAAGNNAPFADQDRIAAYAVDAVSWARARGIISGKGGNRFDPQGTATRAEVAAILQNHANSETPTPGPTPGGGKDNTMTIEANGSRWTAALVENSSTAALKERLRQGPLTVSMHDYGNMEKVGPLGFDLPTNDTPTDTQAGDLILYQGNQLALYYGTNHWNFTRLGRLSGVSRTELLQVLGSGDVEITLRLGA